MHGCADALNPVEPGSGCKVLANKYRPHKPPEFRAFSASQAIAGNFRQ